MQTQKDERAGEKQEETLHLVVMLVALVLVTGVLIKISFLACFENEIDQVDLSW